MSDVRSVEPDAASDPGQELEFDEYLAQLSPFRRALSKLLLGATLVCGVLMVGALVFAIYVSVTGQDRTVEHILSAWMVFLLASGLAAVVGGMAGLISGAIPPPPFRGESRAYSTGPAAITTSLVALVFGVFMIVVSVTVIWNALGLG